MLYIAQSGWHTQLRGGGVSRGPNNERCVKVRGCNDAKLARER